jgi:hypothetical protein
MVTKVLNGTTLITHAVLASGARVGQHAEKSCEERRSAMFLWKPQVLREAQHTHV